MPTNSTKMGEILHKRTMNSKTWINFDLSYTTEIHGGPIHYKDENGKLHNINTDLYDEADFDDMDFPVTKESAFDFRMMSGVAKELKQKNKLNRENMDFQALKVPFEVKIPRHFQSGYSIGKGNDKLKFKPVKASPARGYVNREQKNTITYQDAWNDADVELQVTPTGIKETITLKTDRAPSSFSFAVTGNIDSLTELKLHDAWLEDAEGTRRDVAQNIRHEGGKSYVDLKADVSGLSYPIEIDPTITVNTNQEIGLYDGLDVNNYGPTLMIGQDDPVSFYGIGLFSFDLSMIPVSTDFIQASLNLTVAEFSPDSTDDLYIRRITEDWDDATVTGDDVPTRVDAGLSPFTLPAGDGITHSVDITSLVYAWNDGTYPNYGLLVEASPATTNREIYTSLSSNPSYHPFVEVTYNNPPSAPTVTSPNGGETINAQHTVTWTASTDAEGDSLLYDIQLSTDNGVNWNTITSGVTGTSYDHDFSNAPETSTGLIRIRAYDGTSYSAWDESDGVFTIDHNDAPNIPTNLSPSGGEPVDYQATVRFSWQHNDQNSSDPQSKFDLQWRVVGSATWNTITNTTIQNYYDMPGGVLPADSSIEWRVRTYDQDGLSSPYSPAETFYAGDRPEPPTITEPDGDVAVANPLIQWSSVDQASFLLEVYQAGTLVYSYSGGTNKAHTIQTDLQNNTMYELRLSITNPEGLTSDGEIRSMYVSYTSPPNAIYDLVSNNASGSITIRPNFPEPSGTEPSITHYDVYRGGIRIAKNIDPDMDYVDYTPASNKTYDYFVRVWGDNNTYTDSSVSSASIRLSNAILASVSNPAYETITLDKVTGTSQSTGVERSMLQFAGRKHPVAYFGQSESWNLDTEFLIKGDLNMQALRGLANSRELLLYRDERGRKAFITLAGVSESDVIGNDYYRVSLSPIETYYDERV